MKNVLRKVSDFRLITLAVASTLAIAASNADARAGEARVKAHQGGGAFTTSNTTSVQRSRGADGAVDSVTTGPKGGTATVDRSRNADGTINRSVTRTPAPK